MQIRKSFTRRSWSISSFFVAISLFLTVFATFFVVADSPDATLSYSFEFQEPNLQNMILSDTTFTSVSVPGCISIGKGVGMPNLPVHFVQILIPYGTDVTDISVSGKPIDLDEQSKGVDLKSNPVIPYQKPLYFGEPVTDEFDFDESVYNSDSLFPSEVWKNQGIGSSRGYQILSLGLSPVQYHPVDAELEYYTQLDVTINLEDSESEFNELYRGIEQDKKWVEGLVYNPEILDTYTPFAGLSPVEYPGGLCDPDDDFDYVIITTEQNSLDYWDTDSTTPYNWDSLMDKHETEDGLSCTLVTMEEINAESAYESSDPLFDDTPAHIREFCKDAYQDWGTSYILVGGDQEILPRRLMDYDYESNVETDIYWSNLDNTFNEDGDSDWGEEGDSGFDLYAELFIGSLPCDEPQDVSNWMTKSFYYGFN